MGGTSQSSQTQNSTTAPWEPAQPAINGILSQVQGQLGNTGATGAETNAINSIEANAANTPNYSPDISNIITNMLHGGGATDQAGNVNSNYNRYVSQINPLASNTDYNPYNTPGFSDAIGTMTSDITNNVNGQFAGAGRDFSGANSMALGRGLAQGLAPTIQSQYNANVGNQQGAAGNLYNAGNTNAGIQAGMIQQGLINGQTGITTAANAPAAQNANQNAILQAEAARRGITPQALGLLANIGIPIAGLGGQATGQSNGTQQMSGAQQFGQIAGGVGNLFGGLFGKNGI